MRKFRSLLWLTSVLWLSGCLSGKSFEGGGPPLQEPPCEVGKCTIISTADKNAYEGVDFEFDFSTSKVGPIIYVTNSPSWLKIDRDNTKLYGTPTGPGTYTDVKISIYDGQDTEVIGPFDIVVGGDPLASYAWHLNNTGQSTFSAKGGIAGNDINLAPVIKSGLTGDGIRIAVSDTGVEIDHEDLTDNHLTGESRNYGLVNPQGQDPTPSDPEDGHGTSVAGLIAAKGWNGLGSRGVAPNALFAGFLFLGLSFDLNDYLDQALGDFDIFNYSYGYSQCQYEPPLDEYVEQLIYGVTSQRDGKGSIYVKAAGNNFVGDLSECFGSPLESIPYFGNANMDGDNVTPYTILVAAVNARGEVSSYSSPGANVWVSAPGGEFGTNSPALLSTDMTGCNRGYASTIDPRNSFETNATLNPDCKYTSAMNGTSAATPVTSGVVALMLEANPNLTWRDVKSILAKTATQSSSNPVGHPAGGDYNLPGHTYHPGWVRNAAGYYFNNWFGFGRVNATAAVNMAKTATLLPTMVETVSPHDGTWYYRSADNLGLAIPDASKTGVTSTLTVLHNLVIEAVQVKVRGTHDFVSDLGVELISPSGTRSVLIYINNFALDASLDRTLLTNAFFGESSYGTWTIKLIDGQAPDTGTLDHWEINIFGHVNPNRTDTTPPPPVTGLTLDQSTMTVDDETPVATWNSAAGVMRYEFSIGTASGDDDVVPWQSVGTQTTASQGGLSLNDGETYYFNVRAVDTAENASTPVSASWTVDLP